MLSPLIYLDDWEYLRLIQMALTFSYCWPGSVLQRPGNFNVLNAHLVLRRLPGGISEVFRAHRPVYSRYVVNMWLEYARKNAVPAVLVPFVHEMKLWSDIQFIERRSGLGCDGSCISATRPYCSLVPSTRPSAASCEVAAGEAQAACSWDAPSLQCKPCRWGIAADKPL